jgi:predicted chitinase
VQRRFGAVSKALRSSSGDLYALGFSTKEINEGLASYGKLMRMTGRSQNMSTQELAAGAKSYMKELDALAKITGEDRKQQEAKMERLAKDGQYQMMVSQKDEKVRKSFDALMSQVPAEMQGFIKDVVTTGTVTTEENAKVASLMGADVMNELQKYHAKLDKGEALTIQERNRMNNLLADASQRVAKQYGKTLSANREMDGASGVFTSGLKLAKDAVLQSAAEQDKANKGQDGLNKQIEDSKAKLAAMSNSFTQILLNSGLLDTMMTAFGWLADFIQTVVVPIFQVFGSVISFVVENIDAYLVPALAGMAAGLLTYGAILAANSAAKAYNTLTTVSESGARTGLLTGLLAQIKATWGAAAAALGLSAPMLGLVLGVTAIVALFVGLYRSGWTFSSALEAIGDNLKRFGMNIMEVVDTIRSKLPEMMGGLSTAEKEQRQKERDEARAALDTREAARDAKREEVKRDRGIDDNRKKRDNAFYDGRDAKQAEADAKAEAAATAAAPGGKNYHDPIQTLKDFKGGLAQPGAQTQTPGGSTVPGASAPAMKQDVKQNMELIKAALVKQGITDPKMIAATMGNVMKETGGKNISENLNYGGTDNSRIRKIFGSRAAGKSDAELDSIKKDPKQMAEMMYGSGTAIGQGMGNTEAGDGWKYRGRGFIQLTGKSNYAAASKAIFGDDRLVKNPDLLDNPQVAAEVSAWYMKKGQAGMAKKLGIDTNNMSQEQANLLATSQIAGGDIRKKGAIGQEISAKVDKYSSQMAGLAGAPVTAMPGSSTVNTTLASNSDMAAATASVKTGNRAQQQAGGTTRPMAPAQESAESLLASLNTKMDQLITINRNLSDVNEKQLRVQKTLSSDGYAAA